MYLGMAEDRGLRAKNSDDSEYNAASERGTGKTAKGVALPTTPFVVIY